MRPFALPLFAPALAAIALAGCQQQDAAEPSAPDDAGLSIYQPDFGPTEIFREAIAAAPGHELIVTDLHLPPNAVGDPHSHPWEEYLYVMGGSALVRVDGMEEREVMAGESIVLPREQVHTPVAGPEGIRAIVIRVHDEGDPVSIPAGPAQGE